MSDRSRSSLFEQFPIYLVLTTVMIVGYFVLENSRLNRAVDDLRSEIPQAFQSGAQEGKILALEQKIESLELRLQTAETALGLRKRDD